MANKDKLQFIDCSLPQTIQSAEDLLHALVSARQKANKSTEKIAKVTYVEGNGYFRITEIAILNPKTNELIILFHELVYEGLKLGPIQTARGETKIYKTKIALENDIRRIVGKNATINLLLEGGKQE